MDAVPRRADDADSSAAEAEEAEADCLMGDWMVTAALVLGFWLRCSGVMLAASSGLAR